MTPFLQMSLLNLMPHQGGRRLSHSDGCWWLLHPADNRRIHLDSLFEHCNWRVDHLCAHLGIGKRTFARMVERDLGITSKLWLRHVRAVCACQLLQGNQKIEHVAQVLGFGQPSDFDREFKKLMGISPSFYRHSIFASPVFREQAN